MKALGYLVLLLATLASLVFVQALKPTSHLATAFFSGWLLLPYVVLALVLMFGTRERMSQLAAIVTAVIIAGAGLLFLTDIIYWRPDAQGGFAVLFAPIYQGIGIGVLFPSCQWLFRKWG